jgi:ribonuclease T1
VKRGLALPVFLAALLASLTVLIPQGRQTPENPSLPEVSLADLPPEARETLALIRQGGPFPYAKDGTEFHNREGRLPPKPSGYYREYTVPTPGARDRGARRIVMGAQGEAYYTGDHYRSFMRIRE